MSQIINAILADPIASKVLIFAVTFFIVISIYYATPVQRAVKAILQQISRLIEHRIQNDQSPYDHVFRGNRIAIALVCTMLYSMAILMAAYGSGIVFLSAGDGILWYKKLIGILVGVAVIYFARILKVDGDKELYRLRH